MIDYQHLTFSLLWIVNDAWLKNNVANGYLVMILKKAILDNYKTNSIPRDFIDFVGKMSFKLLG